MISSRVLLKYRRWRSPDTNGSIASFAAPQKRRGVLAEDGAAEEEQVRINPAVEIHHHRLRRQHQLERRLISV